VSVRGAHGAAREAVNYEAWTRSCMAFIRERGLESEFRDFCGGWSPAIHASAAIIAAGPELLATGVDLQAARERHRLNATRENADKVSEASDAFDAAIAKATT
jgi:hypothetical protein